MATKFLTNVSHEGVLYKVGYIIDGLAMDVHEGLVKRGLAETTEAAATHTNEGDLSGLAIAKDPVATPAEPTDEEKAAEAQAQAAAIQKAEQEAAARAAAQVEASTPDAPEHQPTPAEIAAAAASAN